MYDMRTTEPFWLSREALLGRISLLINKPIQGCLTGLALDRFCLAESLESQGCPSRVDGKNPSHSVPCRSRAASLMIPCLQFRARQATHTECGRNPRAGMGHI